jgi:hypothetical protein
MEWSWTAWTVTVAAVALSGAVAWAEGHWRARTGVDLGFANHGGMWGDAWLLPVANAVIAPWLPPGWWWLGPVLVAAAAAVALHAWWHGGTTDGFRDHLWPTRPSAHWATDLSWAGWCHVAFVTGQLALLLAYAAVAVPSRVVAVVTVVLTLHVPLGLLQPAWYATGRVPRSNVRLLVAAVATAWLVGVGKVASGSGL